MADKETAVEKHVLTSKVAALIASGADPVAIAKELEVTVQKVRYVLHTQECRDIVNNLLLEATADLVRSAKKDMAKLLPKAIRTLDKLLDKDDLKAAEIVLKGVGVRSEDNGGGGATSLTVVMPGGETKEVIDITPGGSDEL